MCLLTETSGYSVLCSQVKVSERRSEKTFLDPSGGHVLTLRLLLFTAAPLEQGHLLAGAIAGDRGPLLEAVASLVLLGSTLLTLL